MTSELASDYDPYTIPDDEVKPPTISRPKDVETEDTFHKALAAMYKVDKSAITIRIDGFYKIYEINGKQIFRDRNPDSK